MSSKGQIVIPADMREGLNEGDKLIVIKKNNQFILQKASEKIIEDIEFAKRSDAALKRLEKGKGIRMNEEKFFKEIEKW